MAQEYQPPCSPSRSHEYVVPTGTGFCKKPAAAPVQAKEGSMRVEEQLVDLMKKQMAFSKHMQLRTILDGAELPKCMRQKVYAQFNERLQESGELDLALLDDAIDEAQEWVASERLAEAEATEAWASPEACRDRARERLWAPYGGRPPWEVPA